MGRLPWELRVQAFIFRPSCLHLPPWVGDIHYASLNLSGYTYFCVCVCGGGGGGGGVGGRAISIVISCIARTGVQTFAVSYAFQGFLWYISQPRMNISGQYCTEKVMNITLFFIRMLFSGPGSIFLFFCRFSAENVPVLFLNYSL